MSAFFLYFNDGNPDLAIKPEVIGPQLVHFPLVQWKSFQSKHPQIIYTENKSDTLNIFPDKHNKLLFIIHGYILESEGGITRIDKGESEYSIQNQMRKRYEQGGINSCIGLNGQYNFLVWDPEKSILEIANDRLGISQIFFAHIDDHRFVVTTDIVTLKSVPEYTPKISRRGIFDHLYMGIAFEERTILEDVTRLLPNTSYKASKNGLKLIEEKHLPFSNRNWGALLPELLDELENRYINAIKHSFKDTDKILFLQTGGKDSRLYSHILKKAGIIPQCITAGEKHHAEVYLAREVSRALGFPWQRIPYENKSSLEHLSESLKLDSFSRRILPAIGSMNVISQLARDYDYITGTFLGDVIIGFDYLSPEIKFGKNEKERAENYLNRWRKHSYSENELRQLFVNDGDELISEFKIDIENLMRKLSHDPQYQLVSLEMRANGRFKVGGVLRELIATAPFRLPCLDNDLMDFTFSMPPALYAGRLLIDLFLIQRNQNLAAIPLDLNSKRAQSLHRGYKQELKYKLWSNYIEKVKLPLLQNTGYTSPLTTQSYIHSFSLKERGFQKMLMDSSDSVKSLEGVLNVNVARNLLNRPLPAGDNHIGPGVALRSLVTVTQIAKTFNT